MSSLLRPITNILLDRDGTLIKECHYLCDPDNVELIPGVIAPMRNLQARGVHFFLVTNQSGIGRGYFSREEYQKVQKRLADILAEQGILLTDNFFCPHAPDQECNCRKPRTGMWQELVARHALTPEQTVMIGDKRADITFGLNASLQYTILVLTGHGAKESTALDLPRLHQDILELPERRPGWPHAVARDLGSALAWIAHGFGLSDNDR
ncbi:MAG: HAD family hydrolase [Desulfoplanes sp.]|nr:HAD family hydrolase [Desulfoplanes sp.]MDD4649515.1 HAD family hydrolase [Desulfoplanes sp.]